MPRLLTFILLLFSSSLFSQDISSLKEKIDHIISTKQANIGIAISGERAEDTLFYLKNDQLPTMSVYKLPVVIAVLDQVDKGKFALNQKITFTAADLPKNTYSPLRDKYPNGSTLKLSELIEYTICLSDNNSCDILLKLLGGPEVVQAYYDNIGIRDIHIGATEVEMHQGWDLQYRNWMSPGATNELLRTYYYNEKNLLKKDTHAFLWKTMKATSNGVKRLRGNLPPKTVVAHKTGTSDTNDQGVTAAVNDVGVIFLPDGHYFFISVYVTLSKEGYEGSEAVIADIAKAAYDCFTSVKY